MLSDDEGVARLDYRLAKRGLYFTPIALASTEKPAGFRKSVNSAFSAVVSTNTRQSDALAAAAFVCGNYGIAFADKTASHRTWRFAYSHSYKEVLMKQLKNAAKMACSSLLISLLSVGLAHAQSQQSGSDRAMQHNQDRAHSSASAGQSDSGKTMSSSGASSSGADASHASGSAKGSSAAASAGGSVSTTDRKLMIDLAQANIAEIETAKLAQKQTKNPDVLAFAQKMIDDHTQASTELMQLAQSKGVTLPTEPDAKHQALAKQMSKLKDEKFDRQYMAHAGTADHKATEALLEKIGKSASDPDLKALGAKVLPVVEQHLTMAQDKKK